MESKRTIVIAVILNGPNYLLWSRMVKTALGGRGLWSHCLTDAPKLSKTAGSNESSADGESGSKFVSEEKWEQEDLKVLSILHSSLSPSILEAYSYCESAKDLWSTLNKIYGNISNISRVFEIKKSINILSQEDEEFTAHLGKFRALCPAYSALIQHILRSEKLPTLEEVCSQVQKEEGSIGLFGTKETLSFASQAERSSQPNKAPYKKGDRRGLKCEHCKRDGHTKERCWILNPSLKPAKFK
ncbi:hypothetical protein Bca4012_051301 [Brassica carinata]